MKNKIQKEDSKMSASNKNLRYFNKATSQNAYYRQRIVEAVEKIKNPAMLKYIYIVVLDLEVESEKNI